MSPKKEAKKTLLVVEDDPGLQSQLQWCFEDYNVVVAGERESAISQLRRFSPAVVTLDLGLPPDPANTAEGFAVLGEILKLQPQTKVIVVTGNDERENAVRAVGMGAYDFCEKPVDPEMLGLIVQRAYQLHALEEENRKFSRWKEHSPLKGIIATSAEMLTVCAMVEKVAPNDVSVLLLGESGTGKELLARAVHEMSERKDKRFAVINCAAIPETLLESELFGYEKGAFTGATKQTIGKIEHADGGTLFLDEVGDLPKSLQAKLLRFLQERTIERLGGPREIPVDVRVVCATHQDLKKQMQSGEFREDLFYRISEVTIQIPALRERPGDAGLLALAFVDEYGRQRSKLLRGLSEEALAVIEAYDWPGNVRELENCIKRAVIMAEGKVVGVEALGLDHPGASEKISLNLKEVRDQAERQAIQRALLLCDNKISQVADMLGVSRPTMYDLIQKHGFK